eukprot:3804010-Prymnesium_polylepis.1
MFAVLDDSRRHVAAGGERSWLKRADVGEDGFLSGWEERMRSASSTVSSTKRDGQSGLMGY